MVQKSVGFNYSDEYMYNLCLEILGFESQEEKEKYRARMQRFREIPEDKGGLLRAFIKKEYNRRRYKD